MHAQISELARRLANLLIEQELMIATVESCTGGLIGETLTRIPGSSAWYERGFITYSNDAKRELVQVCSDTLRDCGAVSREVAREMAVGGVQSSCADLAVAVTGVAGPDGGTAEKPVGTVWVAWSDRRGRVVAKAFEFAGDRQQIREATVQAALAGAIDFL